MDSRSSMRTADVVAQVLRAHGAEWAFGHPGGEVVALIDALEKAGIRFVLTRHETSAAFAAGGYAELTGRPGICVATLGPGATNLVTGVASALLERSPIVALTGRLAEAAPAGATHQELRLGDLYTSISKASATLSDVNPAATVRSALAIAMAERPGPVHLALAADVAARPASPASLVPASSAPHGQPAPFDDSALPRARALLAASRRPAIVTGLTAARLRVERAIRECAEQLGAPVALTPKAKGVVAEDHPLFAGVLDMAGDAFVGELLDDADVILAIGCDVVELDRAWTWAAPVIHVDIAPNLDGYYDAEAELVGPIPDLLAALLEGVGQGGWDPADISGCRTNVLAHVRLHSERLQPWQVVEHVQEHAGPEAIATCDVGAHKMVVGQLWRTRTPRTFFMANGLSSMGYSIPTAMALHLVDPQRRVIAFLGDGGLGMYLGELETLVRVGARMTIVVFADERLELIERAAIRRDIATPHVAFDNPDFASLGRAFGISASEVSTEHELDLALRRADSGDGVHLIAARIDGSDYRL